MCDLSQSVREKGIAIGYQQGKIETISKLVAEGLISVDDAVTLTGLSLDKVLELGGLVVDNTIDDTRTSDFFTVRYVRADDPERLARKEKADRALAEVMESLGFGK